MWKFISSMVKRIRLCRIHPTISQRNHLKWPWPCQKLVKKSYRVALDSCMKYLWSQAQKFPRPWTKLEEHHWKPDHLEKKEPWLSCGKSIEVGSVRFGWSQLRIRSSSQPILGRRLIMGHTMFYQIYTYIMFISYHWSWGTNNQIIHIHRSISISMSISISISVSISISLYSSRSISVSNLSLSMDLSIYLSIYLFIYLSIHMCMCIYTRDPMTLCSGKCVYVIGYIDTAWLVWWNFGRRIVHVCLSSWPLHLGHLMTTP